MSVSVNYPQPVQVNGFSCRNCTDVDNAKKHIDPKHPQSGPYGVDAKADPTQSAAVRFSGALAGLQPAGASAAASPKAVGSQVDVTA